MLLLTQPRQENFNKNVAPFGSKSLIAANFHSAVILYKRNEKRFAPHEKGI